jgi:hypothetical protein
MDTLLAKAEHLIDNKKKLEAQIAVQNEGQMCTGRYSKLKPRRIY